jgi:hypothetical protein
MSAREGLSGIQVERLMTCYFDAAEFAVTVLGEIEVAALMIGQVGDGFAAQSRKLADQARELHAGLMAMYRRIGEVTPREY